MKTSFANIFAGSGIRLAVLSVLFAGMAGACTAQASARAAAQTAVAAQTQPDAQAGRTERPAEPAAKGTKGGITVHGHWTIEVKNPDGKLVTHREFENSIVASSGAPFLSALLGRTATTGSWMVWLTDSASIHDAILVTEPTSVASYNCPLDVQNLQQTLGGVGSCSNNLALAAPVLATGAFSSTTFTLTGSGTVPSGFPASIGYVQTQNFECFNTTMPITAQTCIDTAPVTAFATFTARNLDGLNGDPAAVPVSAGQTVAVTVVISFM